MLRGKFAFCVVMGFCISTFVLAETSISANDQVSQSGENESFQKPPQQNQEEKELAKLSPEEYRILVLGTQIYLGRFGYGVGPFSGELDQQTQDGLRAYQKYVGISETGTINKETLKHLTNDNSTLDRILPFIPKFLFEDTNWQEMVSAHGTWALENLPVAEALQTSQISCHRKWNLCSVSTAKIAQGYTPTLLSDTNIYEIDKWDDSEIVTKPSKTGTCASTILRVQREEKTITRKTSIEKSQSGPCMNVAPREVLMHLADGSQIYRALKYQKNQDSQRILRVKQVTKSNPTGSSQP